MELNNTEIGKIQDEVVRIFDELIKNSFDETISEEEQANKYDILVEEVVYLIENIIHKNKSTVFVRHVENHLKELYKKGVNIGDGEVHCKICMKNINDIYKEEIKK